ncbi:hypothetical protein JCM8547_000200 [Rhodosporidiobolus lusitaniae]
MERTSFSSWMIPTGRSAEGAYEEGITCLTRGAPDIAVLRFDTAFKYCKTTGSKTQKALYHVCRARANIRLEKLLNAELDSSCAVRLVTGKDHVTSELESALYHHWLALIEEWEEAYSEAEAEKTFSTAKIRTLLNDLNTLTDKIDADINACPHPRPRAGITPREAVLSAACKVVNVVSLSFAWSSLADKLHTIHGAHNALAMLWEEKTELAGFPSEENERRAGSAHAMHRNPRRLPLGNSYHDYPELAYDTLYLDNNCLDLGNMRASRAPDQSSFFLDVPATRLALRTSRKPRFLPSQYTNLPNDPYGEPYGRILTDYSDRETARWYKVIHQTGRAYIGRREYKTLGLDHALRQIKSYAEDHLEQLKRDPSYLVSCVLDKVRPSRDGAYQLPAIKAALRNTLFNGLARELITREADECLTSLFGYAKATGTASSVLPASYENKIACFTNLIEQYIRIAWGDLKASVKQNFPELDGEDLSGLKPKDATPDEIFWKALQLNPLSSTFEVLHWLGLVEEFVVYSDYPPMGSKRGILSSEEECRNALQLRETLLDSHRPRFSRKNPRTSTVVGHLSSVLKRPFNHSVSLSSVHSLFLSPSHSSLNCVWSAFEDALEDELGGTSKDLLDELITDFEVDKPMSHDGLEFSEEEESDGDSLELPDLEEVEEDGTPTGRRPLPDLPPSPPPPPSTKRREREEEEDEEEEQEPYMVLGAMTVGWKEEPGEEEEEDEQGQAVTGALASVGRSDDFQLAKKPKRRHTKEVEEILDKKRKKREEESKKTPSGVIRPSMWSFLPDTVRFEVGRKDYSTWEDILGGKNLKRTIAFTAVPSGAGSKIFPGGLHASFMAGTSIVFDRPHNSNGQVFSETQAFKLRYQIGEHFGLIIKHFVHT